MNAFEKDIRIFQQYSYHKFLQNICRKRAADEREFDGHFFKKEVKLLLMISLLLQFLPLSCLAFHLKEHQKDEMLREISRGYVTSTEEEFKRRLT